MNKIKELWTKFRESSVTYWVLETWLYMCCALAAIFGISMFSASFGTISDGGQMEEITGWRKWLLRVFFGSIFGTFAYGCYKAGTHVGGLRNRQAWNNVRVPRDLSRERAA